MCKEMQVIITIALERTSNLGFGQQWKEEFRLEKTSSYRVCQQIFQDLWSIIIFLNSFWCVLALLKKSTEPKSFQQAQRLVINNTDIVHEEIFAGALLTPKYHW